MQYEFRSDRLVGREKGLRTSFDMTCSGMTGLLGMMGCASVQAINMSFTQESMLTNTSESTRGKEVSSKRATPDGGKVRTELCT